MATPVYHQDHYIERSSEPTSSGVWAVLAVIIVLLALLFFGSSLFRGNGGGNNNPGGTNIEGTVNTPSGSGSGTVNVQ